MHLRLPRFILPAVLRWAWRHATPYYPIFNQDGSLYMTRHWVARFGDDGLDDEGREQPWCALRLHTIHTSDDGRDPHDHPWSFITLLLDGEYIEHRPGCEPKRYRAGSILFRRAADWHRLELLPAPTLPLTPRTGRRPELVVTTLFFQFPKRQSWGFLKDGKKVYWKTFLAQRNAEARATASPQQGA